MKLKTQILISLFVIFLTISCVNAEDNINTDNTHNTINITNDTYSTYFNDNGNLKVDSGINSGDTIKIGNLTDKQLILNIPINIQKIDADNKLENTCIILLENSTQSNITGLNLISDKLTTATINNYAQDVTIKNNNFIITNNATSAISLYNNINTKIIDNIIEINNLNNQTSAINIFNSNKTNVSGNKISGSGEYLSGIFLIGGNENKLEKNNITSDADNTIGIYTLLEKNDLIVNNTINSTGNSIEGINIITSTENTIIENEIYANCSNTTDSYGILIYGENNNVTRNVIEGNNLNGISTLSNNTNIIFNLIILSSDENLHRNKNNKTELTGIAVTSSNNQINENPIFILNDTADSVYAIHIYKDQEDITNNTINANQIYVESLSLDVHGIYVNDLNNCELDSNFVFLQSEGMVYGFASQPIIEDETYNYTIYNNTIMGRGYDVHIIEIISANNYTIVNNTLIGEGKGAYGVLGENVENTEITDNKINITDNTKINSTNKTKSAIKITGKGKKNKITNNTLTGNTTITVSNTTNETIVENNTIEYPTKINVEDTIIIQNTGSNFTGKLLTLDGTPIVGHHLTINLTRTSNGLWKTYDLVTDYNGEFFIPINLGIGDYTAKLTYSGLTIQDKLYDSSESETVNIKVVKEYDNRTATIISAQALTKTYNSNEDFKGTFTDLNGNSIIGHHLNVKLTRLSSGASKTYDVVTDYTGLFKIPINLAPGLYSAEVSYDGTSQYQPTSTSAISITVNP